MSNSWKQYGGKYKSFKTFSIGTVVADDVLLRQKYSGEFQILGSISVSENVGAKGLQIIDNGDNDLINLTLDPILGTNGNLHITTPMRFGMNANENGAKNGIQAESISTDFIQGSASGIGINTTDASGSFHIMGRPGGVHDLVVSSMDASSSTVLTRNRDNKGIRAVAKESGALSIEFYGNDITNLQQGSQAAIQFSDGKLAFNTDELGFGDANQQKFLRFAYDALGDNYNVFSGTSLNLASAKNEFSNTLIKVAAEDNTGLAIAGGAFPLNPTVDKFGSIGILNTNSKFDTALTIVSDNTVRDINLGYVPNKRVKVGVNTVNPDDGYTFNVNGKMKIENSEINEIIFIEAAPIRIIQDFNPAAVTQGTTKLKYFTGTATGFPSTIRQTDPISYNYDIYDNSNNGLGNWSKIDLGFDAKGRFRLGATPAVSSILHYVRLDVTPNINSVFRVVAADDSTIRFNRGIDSTFESRLKIIGKQTWANNATLSTTDTDEDGNFIVIKQAGVSSRYFGDSNLGEGRTHFKYAEVIMRPDNYLIIILQEIDGFTFMLDFGRSYGNPDTTSSDGTSRGSQIYGANVPPGTVTDIIGTPATNIANKRKTNVLFGGNEGNEQFSIPYFDISLAIVDIDLSHNQPNDSIHHTFDVVDNSGHYLYVLGTSGFLKFKNSYSIPVIPSGENEFKIGNESQSTIGLLNDQTVQLSDQHLLTNRYNNRIEISNKEHFNMSIYRDDRNYMVAVGDNQITYSLDGGGSWNIILAKDIPDISLNIDKGIPAPKLRGLEIVDDKEIYIVGDGTIIYNLDGSSNLSNLDSNGQYSGWKSIPEEFLNISGVGTALTSQNSKLIDFKKIDQDNYYVTRYLQDFSYNQTHRGEIVTIHLYLPNWYNRETNDVLDICGNVMISGNLNFDYTSKLSSNSNLITVANNTDLKLENNLDVSGIIHSRGVVYQF
jgi:hypothetical protein